jgi:hypothetical protein
MHSKFSAKEGDDFSHPSYSLYLGTGTNIQRLKQRPKRCVNSEKDLVVK